MSTAALIACACLAILGMWVEWSRAMRRRALRVGAALMVAILLGLLAWRPHGLRPPIDRAVVRSNSPNGAAYADVEALATQLAPQASVRVEGDGLGHDALALLQGFRIEWQAPTARLGLARLAWPRRATVGEQIRIEGALDVHDSTWVGLHHPDGHADSVRTDSAFAFTVTTKVAGTWTWAVAIAGRYERLGIDVRDPPAPSIVIVEGRPGREAAGLAAMVLAQGGGVVQRTRLTAQDDRVTLWGAARPARVLDDSVLARIDALVLGPGGLAALSRAERDAVQRQLARGLGVVHLVDSALARSPLFPFKVVRTGAGTERVRVAIDSSTVSKVLMPATAISLAGGVPMLRTTGGAPVAWRVAVGEGAVIASRVTMPSRWGLAGEDTVERAWWAALMSAAMRPPRAEWRVAPDELPRVDHRLTIERVGMSSDSVLVTDGGVTGPATLRITVDSMHRRIDLWPSDTGWMTIVADNDSLLVHMGDRDAFASVDRGARRDAMRAGPDTATRPTLASPGSRSSVPMPLWWVWTLMVGALAVVWTRAPAR